MRDPTAHKIIINKDVVFDEMPLMKSYLEDGEMKQEEEPQFQQIQLQTQPFIIGEDHEVVHEDAPKEEDVKRNFPIN